MHIKRHYPIGAEIIPKKGVHFRVWAPDHKKVTLLLENDDAEAQHYLMTKEKDGYFSLLLPEAKEGTHYRYKLGTSKKLLADPASRYQPLGPIGPSCVVNPIYEWTDEEWPGISMEGQILYEMHLGTFTKEGTFKAAMEQLEELKRLGITTIELMPLNEFVGHFGWGYDGVLLFAPYHEYGIPEDVKAFIDKAHKLGLGVILDVVYNHLGPDGNQMIEFTKEYLSEKNITEWGKTINFDSPEVREFFLTNVRYWIEEFHFDGLRVDATPWFFSSTPLHILEDITRTALKAAGKKNIIICGENEPEDTKLIKPYEEGGYNFDALWNDDFHHTALVRLTGKREAYYTDYLGSVQEFISALKYGFLYQGQYYEWQKKKRGKANFNILPKSMIIFLENHDQLANSGNGKRVHQLCDPGNYKSLVSYLLLSPNTPLLFQGQEYGSSHPFLYFADHSAHMNELIFEGRKKSLSQFPRLATRESQAAIPNPSDPLTFTECKLDFNERITNSKHYDLYKDLIKLRKNDPVFKIMQNIKIDGAVIGTEAFLIRYFGGEQGDRLLIINFGPDHVFVPVPEPLMAPEEGFEWSLLWSSESPKYGGEGTTSIHTSHWKILGHSSIVLKAKPINKKKKTNASS
jgi:maltooligosyltrehalose trehalohydrolase